MEPYMYRIPADSMKIALPELFIPPELTLSRTPSGLILPTRFGLTAGKSTKKNSNRRAKKPQVFTGIDENFAIEIPEGAIEIPAPDLPQPTSASCALAGASIARMYGVGPDSMFEFMKKMKTSGRTGTYYGNIAKYLNELGLDAQVEQDISRDYLISLLNQKIPVILSIQAWGNPKNYDKNGSGHYVTAIGWSYGPPVIVGRADRRSPKRGGKLSATAKGRLTAAEYYFYFMDPSILCRRGFLSWPNLDARWHENEGSSRKPEISHHLGIIVRPNGHKAIHDTVAEPIL